MVKDNFQQEDLRRERSTRHVLVGEDNPVNRMVLTEQLRALGYQCATAADGEEVLAALAKGSYDLILMDCQMPRMDGCETARRIRAAESLSERLPIVALTAHGLNDDRRECISAGMDDYIVKPLVLADLAAVLDRWLDIVVDKGGVEGERAAAAEYATLEPSSIHRLRHLERMTGREIVAPAAGKLKAEAELGLEAMSRFLGEGNFLACESVAHGLKGSGAALGAHSFARSCAEVEVAARGGRAELMPDLLAKAVARFARLLPDLDFLMEGSADD